MWSALWLVAFACNAVAIGVELPRRNKTLPLLTKSPQFELLRQNARSLVDSGVSIGDLMEDAGRNEQLTLKFGDTFLDLTRQRIDTSGILLLLEYARQRKVDKKIIDMLAGRQINMTEKRAVLHVALRAPKDSQFLVNGKNVMPEVHEVLDRIETFSDAVRGGDNLGYKGDRLKDVVCIGIGGSYLGPEFVFEALRTDPTAEKAAEGRRLRFLANVDPIDVKRALQGFDPKQTLVVIISKTFTTAETMLNARTVRQWLLDSLHDESAISRHVVAISTNVKAAEDFGIAKENVFGFWDWVGGRFSVTSAVGVLPLSLQYGHGVVKEFLRGAHEMDRHFETTKLDRNLPVMSALIAHWNSQVLKLNTVAILPYCQSLHRFPAHIQQLNMESNGKAVTMSGWRMPYRSGPVIFGEPGTNGQHSFYQLMHQGQVVPAEFIGFVKSQNPIHLKGEAVSNHEELMSNFFAQPDALALGKSSEAVAAEGVEWRLIKHKTFSGNRPSTVLLMPKADAYYLGVLLALYEHRTAVEGFLLDINSFDQWGVELGKTLAKNVRVFFDLARQEKLQEASKLKDALPLPTKRMIEQYIKVTEESED